MKDLVVRLGGVLAGGMFALVSVLTVGSSSEPVLTAFIVAIPLLSAAIFAWTILEDRQLKLRRLGFAGMVVGTIPLVSFAFVVVPLLLVALPCLWLRPAAGAQTP